MGADASTLGALTHQKNTKLQYNRTQKQIPILNEMRNYNKIQLLNNKQHTIQNKNILLTTGRACIMIFFFQVFFAVHTHCLFNLSATL